MADVHVVFAFQVINFKKAVMKMDIEGHEHRALTHSQALFDKVLHYS